jgi:hypothetical protein
VTITADPAGAADVAVVLDDAAVAVLPPRESKSMSDHSVFVFVFRSRLLWIYRKIPGGGVLSVV